MSDAPATPGTGDVQPLDYLRRSRYHAFGQRSCAKPTSRPSCSPSRSISSDRRSRAPGSLRRSCRGNASPRPWRYSRSGRGVAEARFGEPREGQGIGRVGLAHRGHPVVRVVRRVSFRESNSGGRGRGRGAMRGGRTWEKADDSRSNPKRLKRWSVL
jgi:hypothetical protein